MRQLHQLPAFTLASMIREGEVSSREVTEYFLGRIDRLNPDLNAVVWLDREEALRAADRADLELRKAEADPGPLHGVPMTLKDCYEVLNMPTTAGSPTLKDHYPARDSAVAATLRKAGAIILGHTNVPLWASDLQSYNAVYGRSNNPWDRTRTPGGSSGGAAAALATGMTPLEVGSDIGGSIRTPAHFCGVYGHKPTQGLIPLRGHVPGPPGVVSPPDLAVAGPMANTIDDLEKLFDILRQPDYSDRNFVRLELPDPRFRSLADCRVALWFKDPDSPIDSEVDEVYHRLIEALSRARCPWQYQSPFDLSRILPIYFNLLGSVIGPTLPSGPRMQMRLIGWLSRFIRLPNLSAGMEQFARAANQSHGDWARWNELRHQLIHHIEGFFDQFDILLCPVTPTAAIPHQTDIPFEKRKLKVSGRLRPYSDLMTWIAPATCLGLPATSAPVGQTSGGLPVNVQIIGGRGMDRQTLEFARLLSNEGLGFNKPG